MHMAYADHILSTSDNAQAMQIPEALRIAATNLQTIFDGSPHQSEQFDNLKMGLEYLLKGYPPTRHDYYAMFCSNNQPRASAYRASKCATDCLEALENHTAILEECGHNLTKYPRTDATYTKPQRSTEELQGLLTQVTQAFQSNTEWLNTITQQARNTSLVR